MVDLRSLKIRNKVKKESYAFEWLGKCPFCMPHSSILFKQLSQIGFQRNVQKKILNFFIYTSSHTFSDFYLDFNFNYNSIFILDSKNVLFLFACKFWLPLLDYYLFYRIFYSISKCFIFLFRFELILSKQLSKITVPVLILGKYR